MPGSKLPKNLLCFCKYHSKEINESDGKFDCHVHLHEARCFGCNYTYTDIRYDEKRQNFYMAKPGNQYNCVDFEPRNRWTENLVIKSLKKRGILTS